MGSQGLERLFCCRCDNKMYSNERYNKALLLLFGQANQRKSGDSVMNPLAQNIKGAGAENPITTPHTCHSVKRASKICPIFRPRVSPPLRLAEKIKKLY